MTILLSVHYILLGDNMRSKVYIEKAEFSSLGYIVETEEQRRLSKLISEGANSSSDSPRSQIELHYKLDNYLSKNATVIDGDTRTEFHSSYVTYETSSKGVILLDDTLGWSTIECDESGKNYLSRLLREWNYSVDTVKTAYTG